MKAKFKIAALAATPIDVNLVHPKHGETDIVIKMVGPHSTKWRDAYNIFTATDGKEADTLNLMASAVCDWDEEAFEMPCTYDNVKTVLGNPTNEWITSQVVAKVKDIANFFL